MGKREGGWLKKYKIEDNLMDKTEVDKIKKGPRIISKVDKSKFKIKQYI